MIIIIYDVRVLIRLVVTRKPIYLNRQKLSFRWINVEIESKLWWNKWSTFWTKGRKELLESSNSYPSSNFVMTLLKLCNMSTIHVYTSTRNHVIDLGQQYSHTCKRVYVIGETLGRKSGHIMIKIIMSLIGQPVIGYQQIQGDQVPALRPTLVDLALICSVPYNTIQIIRGLFVNILFLVTTA